MHLLLSLLTEGELVSTVDSLSRFNFNVKEGNHAYNQKHYEALGEVTLLDICCHLYLFHHLLSLFTYSFVRCFIYMGAPRVSVCSFSALMCYFFTILVNNFGGAFWVLGSFHVGDIVFG